LILSSCRVHGRERPVWSCGVVDWFGRPLISPTPSPGHRQVTIRMCLFFFVRRIFSTLPCLEKLGVAPKKHQVTSHQLVSQYRRRQASEARQGQGRRRIAPSLRDPAMPTCVGIAGSRNDGAIGHGSWSACSTVLMDVDDTPRDSSASSRQCAICICTPCGRPYLHAMRSPLQLALWSSREAPPQTLYCSRARAPTKT